MRKLLNRRLKIPCYKNFYKQKHLRQLQVKKRMGKSFACASHFHFNLLLLLIKRFLLWKLYFCMSWRVKIYLLRLWNVLNIFFIFKVFNADITFYVILKNEIITKLYQTSYQDTAWRKKVCTAKSYDV